MAWRSAKWRQRLQHRRRRRHPRIGDAQTLFQIEAGERKKNPAKIWFMWIFYSWVIAIFTFTKICAYSLVQIVVVVVVVAAAVATIAAFQSSFSMQLIKTEVSKNRWIVQLYSDVNSGHEFRLLTLVRRFIRRLVCVVYAFFSLRSFKTKSAEVENRIAHILCMNCAIVCVVSVFFALFPISQRNCKLLIRWPSWYLVCKSGQSIKIRQILKKVC